MSGVLALTHAGSIVWNGVILASAVVPVMVVIVICVVFMRAARRNDEREALAKQNRPPAP